MSEEVLHHLCHKLFIANPDGKKLIQLIKERYLSIPVFPMSEQSLNLHGGATGYANYRAGELALMLKIEHMAREYEQKFEAEQKKGAKSR